MKTKKPRLHKQIEYAYVALTFTPVILYIYAGVIYNGIKHTVNCLRRSDHTGSIND